MKKFFLILGVTASIVACKNEEKKETPTTPAPIVTNQSASEVAKIDSTKLTAIEWEGGTTQQLGTITLGQTVKITYNFKNTGDKPLIIESVSPGCGCTLASKPEQPILPGASDKIVAEFKSEGQHPGAIHKEIRVRANTKPSMDHLLDFKLDIKDKK